MTALFLMISLASQGQAAPNVIVHAADGPKSAAPLLEVGVDFTIKLGGAKPVAGRDLIALRQVGVAQPASCPPPFVQLTTGDRLPIAGPVGLDDETLHVTLSAPFANEKTSFPQSALAFLALTSGAEPADRGERDVVVLKNGDRLAGKLAAIDGDKVSLEVAGKTQAILLDRVAGVRFNPAFQSRPNPKAPYAEIVFANGARLSAAKLSSIEPAGRLAGVNLFGHRFTFAAADVAALRMRRGKATYLDDVKPTSYESTPFLDVTWPLAVGKTVAGAPLKIGADVFPLGLGMHSRSKVTYVLDKDTAWFEAVVAIDTVAGPRGSVRIDVEVDGKPAAGATRVIKAGDAPVPLRIDVRNAKTITLVTDFGPRGDVQGHAIWADARIVRE